MHLAICNCSECFAAKLSPPIASAVPELAAAWADVTAEADAHEAFLQGIAERLATIPAAPLALGSAPGFAMDDAKLPPLAVGCTVVGSVTIKSGSTHAVLLYDPLSHKQFILYWERHATTHGMGEWALIEIDNPVIPA